jgi:hypothetical protein
MDTAVLCRSCSWFGVYRVDVTDRIRGCPICGNPELAVRDVGAEQWAALGQQLLDDGPADDDNGRRYGDL